VDEMLKKEKEFPKKDEDSDSYDQDEFDNSYGND
jgi:hypothetical protein